MAALSRLEGEFNIVNSSQLIDHEAYYGELLGAKICVSPWGYGEVCYRDFEAILAGALLVKPAMEHLRTFPDIYVPHETYVPVQPDFSDLVETCVEYLGNDRRRREITQAALWRYCDYFSSGASLRQVEEVVARLSACRPRESALAPAG